MTRRNLWQRHNRWQDKRLQQGQAVKCKCFKKKLSHEKSQSSDLEILQALFIPCRVLVEIFHVWSNQYKEKTSSIQFWEWNEDKFSSGR